jgi:hypothetical protein
VFSAVRAAEEKLFVQINCDLEADARAVARIEQYIRFRCRYFMRVRTKRPAHTERIDGSNYGARTSLPTHTKNTRFNGSISVARNTDRRTQNY